MKASEARSTAEKNAAVIAKAQATEAEKNRLARIRSEKKKRDEFRQQIVNDAKSSIEYAVSQGEKSTRLSYTETKSRYSEAEEAFDKHRYIDLIKALILKLNRDGFKTKMNVQSDTHTTQHESSVPDYSYQTYYKYIEVSW